MTIFSKYLLYKISFLIWCVLLSSFILNAFSQLIPKYLTVRYDYKFEMIMVIAQVGFQWLFMITSSWNQRISYMFIALTVSMVGSLLLIPLLLFNSLILVSQETAVIYFFVVVFTIFLLHYKLLRRYSLPFHLTLTWILYRSFLLAFVTFPY